MQAQIHGILLLNFAEQPQAWHASSPGKSNAHPAMVALTCSKPERLREVVEAVASVYLCTGDGDSAQMAGDESQRCVRSTWKSAGGHHEFESSPNRENHRFSV